MAIQSYLAMTPEEFALYGHLPKNPALMCCPFSQPIPENFPPGGLLVLTDRDPAVLSVADRWVSKLRHLPCRGVLLDFQRPGSKDALAFAKTLLNALSCPVAVSQVYGKELRCPVFLPPVPGHMALRNYISPWKDREIWLDISPEAETITLTEMGAVLSSLPGFQPRGEGHTEKALHCHYSIALTENTAEFTLWRTGDDLLALLKEAENCGIRTAVGLYQELGLWNGTDPFRKEV